MSFFCQSCLQSSQPNYPLLLQAIHPTPLKVKLLSSLSLLPLILKNYIQPHRKQPYSFDPQHLYFIQSQHSHLPVVYYYNEQAQKDMLLVYCHGIGSNLNRISQYVQMFHQVFGVAVVGFDYTGEGQSQKQFSSYLQDIRTVIAWSIQLGYKLNRTIICGYSLGSHPALCLNGQMPRILISPICGLISYIQTKAARYQQQKYDNISLALRLKCKYLIFHCSSQMVDISHGMLLAQALAYNSDQSDGLSQFVQIREQKYDHKSSPCYLFSQKGRKIVMEFIQQIDRMTKDKEISGQTKQLYQQLIQLKVTCSRAQKVQQVFK